MSDIKIGQEVWWVITSYPHVSVWSDNGHIVLNNTKGSVTVKKVFVGAIQRVETTEESAKYFFNAKTKYHYSEELGGVCTEQSYFTISGNNLIGGYNNNRFYLTEDAANTAAKSSEESQEKFIAEQAEEIRDNLNDILQRLG